MVREEYLNLEFMYKFINSLCKRDGYHMTDFEFGKMSYYRNEDTPFVLRNNMGYNIVYKFEAWKLPEKFDLNKEIELDLASVVSAADLKAGLQNSNSNTITISVLLLLGGKL